ncbi:hypothetical protein PSTG_04147 [Puccinia striiformis f. sp. tritici PST-78]|uniref:Myb/SANT-like domain-containing protein n=1 Tax=Puccinia striiformis f. sp. tritici PST-78 TaxID=1165861 RepID=A0A0L0VTE7_9BASI|nr:hypothetical protein PSTG_04147 [Puccinia striiformis f. sp. tritici PST-78]
MPPKKSSAKSTQASSRRPKAPRLLGPGQPPSMTPQSSTSTIHTTNGTQATNLTVSTQASNTTGGTQASNTTGETQASKTSGGTQASDPTGAAQASDTTGATQASETASGTQASDSTGATQASDTTAVTQASDTTGGTQMTSGTHSTDSISGTQATASNGVSQSTVSGGTPKPNVNASWTDANDVTMVHTLIDEKAIHPSALNGFKPSSWAQVLKALAGSEKLTNSKPKDVASCKARWYALKRLYSSFKTVKNMSGAGWDETTKMVVLPKHTWEELALNTSPAGKDLSRWEKQAFPLFCDLVNLVEPGSAKGDLAETTADDGPTASGDIGNDIAPDSPVDLEGEENDLDDDEAEVTVATVSSTQSPSKRKRGSAISPDVFFSELKAMSTSLAESMSAPIPPISFMPSSPQTSIHMQACVLVQKDPGLEPDQIFKAIDFLGVDKNADIYVSLSEILLPTWLRMKMGDQLGSD